MCVSTASRSFKERGAAIAMIRRHPLYTFVGKRREPTVFSKRGESFCFLLFPFGFPLACVCVVFFGPVVCFMCSISEVLFVSFTAPCKLIDWHLMSLHPRPISTPISFSSRVFFLSCLHDRRLYFFSSFLYCFLLNELSILNLCERAASLCCHKEDRKARKEVCERAGGCTDRRRTAKVHDGSEDHHKNACQLPLFTHHFVLSITGHGHRSRCARSEHQQHQQQRR